MSLKRDLERKQREEQEATAHAFQEFINTFQDYSGPPNKTFVKSGVLYGKKGEENQYEKGQIYNPKPLIKHNSNMVKNAIECATLLKETKLEKVKGQEKPKSNLELLKEELKQRHLERDERKYKYGFMSPYVEMNYSEGADPNSTNIFVANLNQKVTENDLMQLFGAFGPLASVKIMWPRGDEKGRTTNCGFVAFMSRKDADRALKQLKNRDDMRIGWGKAVELPNNPVYIPPELLKLSLPPPASGLPFNAQPVKGDYKKPTTPEDLSELLNGSLVRVTIPYNKKILMMVHRMIEFVVTEGPLFEAMIMNREINNPTFQFLFDNKSPAHIYYRWKLYSILHGESQRYWSTKPFRMFKGGSIWIPPLIPNYFDGMPDYLTNKHQGSARKLLSDTQKNRLVQYIQNLSLNGKKIGEAMVFCMNHIDAYGDIIDVLSDSFGYIHTKADKKIARLYLLSDLLYNSEMKKKNSNVFRVEVEKHIINIFRNLQGTFNGLKKEADREAFKGRVLKVLRSWDLWKLYPNEMLSKLEKITIGDGPLDGVDNDEDSSNDEPLDGANLIKRSLKNNCGDTSDKCQIVVGDGQEKKETGFMPGFIPSRWETVDPEQVEAQAMSTKKFYDLEQQRFERERQEKKAITEQEREKLRNIELMVMQFQVEVEIGKRKLKKGTTLEEGLQQYRKHLLEKLMNPVPPPQVTSNKENTTYHESDKSKKKSSKKQKEKHNKNQRKH